MPVITNVSVDTTSATNGEIYLAWSPPSELDTVTFPPPYQYKVYHGLGFSGPSDLIYESEIGNILYFDDTTYTHLAINTRDTAHHYRVDFHNSDNFQLVTQSAPATSVFLNLIPNDNQLTLDIQYVVPWINESYDIY